MKTHQYGYTFLDHHLIIAYLYGYLGLLGQFLITANGKVEYRKASIPDFLRYLPSRRLVGRGDGTR